jgi:hypothetical protein
MKLMTRQYDRARTTEQSKYPTTNGVPQARTVSIGHVGILLAPHDRVPIRIPRDFLPLTNLPRASQAKKYHQISLHSPNPNTASLLNLERTEPERAEADGDGDVLLGHRFLIQTGEQRGRGPVERELRGEPIRGRGRSCGRRRRVRLRR